jgi:two-component system response regulator AlgR
MNQTSSRRVLIADDEPLARERLRRLVEALDGYSVCGEADEGAAALQAVAEQNPDIVLLDIRMPGMDGMQAAAQLAGLANPPALIFCTAYDRYAVHAFEVQAAAYLLKPVRREALQQALQRAGRVNRLQARALLEAQTNDPAHLAIRTHRGTELIDLDRVRYCEADQKYVTLHHSGGETVTDYTLKELEQAYPDRFLRVHRHTLASTAFIQSLVRTGTGQHQLFLRGMEQPLQVSRRHAPGVRRWLDEHQPGSL